MEKSLCNKLLLLLVLCLSSITMTFGQKKFSPTSYISQHKDVAKQLMRETGVPASVILAVAIHESAYGNSKIATNLNNHFGIKGKNNSKVIRSAYKGYESVLSSYRDFVALLMRRKSTQPLFDKYSAMDYKSWIAGISRSGYSVSGDWKGKVLSTINRYNLNQYDESVN